jgi:hypothetical protein
MGTDHEQLAHGKLEKNIGLLAILTAIAVSIGGLAEIVPMMHDAQAIEPLPGVKPYPALQLAGRGRRQDRTGRGGGLPAGPGAARAAGRLRCWPES